MRRPLKTFNLQVCVTDAFAILGDISPLKLYVNPTDMRCKIAIYYFHQCFSHSFSIELFLLPLKHPSLLHCHSGVYFFPLFILCLTLYSPLNNMYITSWCSSYQQFFCNGFSFFRLNHNAVKVVVAHIAY